MSERRDHRPHASFATDWRASKGRRYPEADSRTRTPFARDRDRIIHTSAFRRLKEKTQVFVAHEGDLYRTRLTHSLEVAQIARSTAAAMGLDADLAETIALAHDLGHPPFAHSGEDELERQMSAYGGFDHNVQTFRVVTELETRYPNFPGLNLTWETLEGVVKHNGPVSAFMDRPSWKAIGEFDAEFPLDLGGWASAEAQVAALSDDIAYNNHDVDDGLQAGLFRLADLEDVPLIGPILMGVRTDYPDLDDRLTRLEAVRRMIGAMIDDVLAETARRVADGKVTSPDHVRRLGKALVAFSPEMNEDLSRLRAFLYERMYRHWRVNRTRSQARRILAEMFELFLREPDVMPNEWGLRGQQLDEAGRARLVCDYIAGMTDRFAIEEHKKLFQLDAWNRRSRGDTGHRNGASASDRLTGRSERFAPGARADMSDDHRGAYTPPSDRVAFDPREPVRSGPPPVTLILSGLVLIALIGGVAFLYRHGIRHPGASPAEVGQPVGEMKTPAPADANVAASTSLTENRATTNAAPNFASAPEQPLPRPNPVPVVVVPPPAASAGPQAVSAAAPPPPPPIVAGAQLAKPAKPLTIASLANDADAPAPPKPKAAVIAPKPAPAPAAVAAPAAGWVQIGAFSSPALAAKGWSDIAKLAPAAMAGKGKTVQPVTAGGRVLYRTYITGFASRDAAEAFCGKLKAAGKNCFVK